MRYCLVKDRQQQGYAYSNICQAESVNKNLQTPSTKTTPYLWHYYIFLKFAFSHVGILSTNAFAVVFNDYMTVNRCQLSHLSSSHSFIQFMYSTNVSVKIVTTTILDFGATIRKWTSRSTSFNLSILLNQRYYSRWWLQKVNNFVYSTLLKSFERWSFICLISFPAMPETEEQNRIRFQVELEFVQCLANPNYIHCKYKNCYFVAFWGQCWLGKLVLQRFSRCSSINQPIILIYMYILSIIGYT